MSIPTDARKYLSNVKDVLSHYDIERYVNWIWEERILDNPSIPSSETGWPLISYAANVTHITMAKGQANGQRGRLRTES